MKAFAITALSISSLLVSNGASAAEPCPDFTNVYICETQNLVQKTSSQDEIRIKQKKSKITFIEDEYQKGGNPLTFNINGRSSLWNLDSSGHEIETRVETTCSQDRLVRVFTYKGSTVAKVMSKTEKGMSEDTFNGLDLIATSDCVIPTN